MNDRRQCPERWGSDRCQLPEHHAADHRTGVLLWSKEAPPHRPKWFQYLRARENAL